MDETNVQAEPDKTCTACRELKPAAAFHRRGVKGRHPICGTCRAATRTDRSRGKRKRPITPQQARSSRLWTRYGISNEQYETMLIAQSGCCALCRRPPKPTRRLAVDHCHETGVVRALLCTYCNLHVGVYENFQERISNYLATYGTGNPVLKN